MPTSTSTRELAESLRIPLAGFGEIDRLELVVDGPDEVDRDGHMIKGGGACLLWERIVADAADHYVVVADTSKLKDRLGAFPLPIEVVPHGWESTTRSIAPAARAARLPGRRAAGAPRRRRRCAGGHRQRQLHRRRPPRVDPRSAGHRPRAELDPRRGRERPLHRPRRRGDLRRPRRGSVSSRAGRSGSAIDPRWASTRKLPLSVITGAPGTSTRRAGGAGPGTRAAPAAGRIELVVDWQPGVPPRSWRNRPRAGRRAWRCRPRRRSGPRRRLPALRQHGTRARNDHVAVNIVGAVGPRGGDDLVEAGERDPQPDSASSRVDVEVGTPRTSESTATAAPSGRTNQWLVVPEPSPSSMPGFT